MTIRWFTKPWGVRGGKPGSRSKKAIHRGDGKGGYTVELLQSKCDHVKVKPGSVSTVDVDLSEEMS